MVVVERKHQVVILGGGFGGLYAARALKHAPVEVTLLVPYGRDEVIALLYRAAEVLETEPGTDGTLVRARVGDRELAAVGDYVVATRRRRASGL